ncbi:MAG: tripartite tricarboxylate transporter TctB family protein [Gammaproteobacteria bacterium]|nr:tripartite tricarboxylate transporter TctB family protein [Gammaproteobacteria bacterium]
MRLAELVMAVVLAFFSAYLMWKSSELPTGWVPDQGPGGGAFPFWLSMGMLLSTLWILVRGVRRVSPPSQSSEPFFDSQSAVLIGMVVAALTGMIGLIHWIGVYGAIPLFFVFYMKIVGRHSWLQTSIFAICAPVITFFFFEILLHITLPKGATEPLFYPLYDIFL